MPPDTMIERVARALCEAQGFTWEQAGDPMQSGSGEDERDGYVLLARVAIRALMEPTDGMRVAGVYALTKANEPEAVAAFAEGDHQTWAALSLINSDQTDAVFVAMLTAALKEKTDA